MSGLTIGTRLDRETYSVAMSRVTEIVMRLTGTIVIVVLFLFALVLVAVKVLVDLMVIHDRALMGFRERIAPQDIQSEGRTPHAEPSSSLRCPP
jgi:hypothetical protein